MNNYKYDYRYLKNRLLSTGCSCIKCKNRRKLIVAFWDDCYDMLPVLEEHENKNAFVDELCVTYHEKAFLEDIERGNRHDGRFGDIARIKCPKGHVFREDINHCAKCNEDYIQGINYPVWCNECNCDYDFEKNEQGIVSADPQEHEHEEV